MAATPTDLCTPSYIEELVSIQNNDVWDVDEKLPKMRRLLDLIAKDATAQDGAYFPNLYSRLQHLASKYSFKRELTAALHQFRIAANKHINGELKANEHAIAVGVYSISHLLEAVSGDTLPEIFKKISTTAAELEAALGSDAEEESEFIYRISLCVEEVEQAKRLIHCESTDNSRKYKVRYDVANINQEFTSTVEQLVKGDTIELVDIKVEDGYYTPNFIIYEPDYLIDVSTVAAQANSLAPAVTYFHSKYELQDVSLPLLKGNIINFFFDALCSEDDAHPADIAELIKETFRQFPLDYTYLFPGGSTQLREFLQDLTQHYVNLKRFFQDSFTNMGFERHKSTLEPSFFSCTFGLQGRADFLYQDTEAKEKSTYIIELKSGKAPHTHTYFGVWPNHAAQARLYRLLVRYSSGVRLKSLESYILYSSAESDSLRQADTPRTVDKELINLRNELVALEFKLARARTFREMNPLLLAIDEEQLPEGLPNYITDRVERFADDYSQMSELSRRYVASWTNFIAQEHLLAKTGDCDSSSRGSQADMWRAPLEEKTQNLDVLRNLTIVDVEQISNSIQPRLTLKRHDDTKFTALKVGDVCVLYPIRKHFTTPVDQQVHKVTIVEIDEFEVTLKFRQAQHNKELFLKYNNWVLEPDYLDRSTTDMYKSLRNFMASNFYKRELLLGIQRPGGEEVEKEEGQAEQVAVVEQAVNCQDYFLINGPPGTGKTSHVLKNIVTRLHEDENETILVIAYTNRAVDEICTALGDIPYLRVGSEHSTAPELRDQLVQCLMRDMESRAAVANLINDCRIIVGTLASLGSKPVLFKLKNFTSAVVDEASQILEPQIIGLLSQTQRFILIGDHKQLPAISLQNEELAHTDDEELLKIKLKDRRISYFERLFCLASCNGWSHVMGTLAQQGRMHRELMAYPNSHGYNNLLQTLMPSQEEDLSFKLNGSASLFSKELHTSRLVFYNLEAPPNPYSDKCNEHEAILTARIAAQMYSLYKNYENSGYKHNHTIGIITPWRSQVALVKLQLSKQGIDVDDCEGIAVDTVERYQGSARDVIIISLCTSKRHMLRRLVNMNNPLMTDEEAIDRKLNVMLTRPRKQLIMIGNNRVLSASSTYSSYIEHVRENGIYADAVVT